MIEYINFKLTGNTEKRVRINLNSKNVIITGANGCGKTRFLHQLNDYLQQFLERHIQPAEKIQPELERYKHELDRRSQSDQYYNHYKNMADDLTKKLERLSNEEIIFTDVESIFSLVNSNSLILRFFEANRLTSHLAGNGHIESISSVKQQGKNESFQQDSSDKFERYLVGYYNYGSHVIARENNPEKSKQIDEWFNKVENDLQNLFEDPNLTLKYNAEEHVSYIIQQGKEPFRFNNLSSGYSSILSIYADLLMKVELREIPADEISGFVLIDEIDAHLHVSIQRKIFSFFDKAFPKIQFIVTTHSPFVVQSVNDSIIYDLSKMECLEDLSMYSYESILKGLLGVESTSNLLNEQLDEMAELVQQSPINIARLKNLVKNIEPHASKLNSRSRAFLLLGKNAILDSNDGEE